MKYIYFFLAVLWLPSWGQSPQKQYSSIESHGVNLFITKRLGKADPLLIINGGPGMSSEGFIPSSPGTRQRATNHSL